MTTVLPAASPSVGAFNHMDVAAHVKEALREVRQPTVVRIAQEQKGKRPRRREDAMSGQSSSPPKSVAKKPPKQFDSNQKGQSATPNKKASGVKEAGAQAPAKASNAAPRKQTSAAVLAPKGPVTQDKKVKTSQPPLADAKEPAVPKAQPIKAASRPASIDSKVLQEAVMSKWAGPGFSLPPTPDALPMPSKFLLVGKAK